MKLNLPNRVDFVLDTLIKNGHKAYIVGGCVRDLLRGKEPNDYDITTSAKPNEIKKLFAKTVSTGEQHGTISVFIDREQIEVTTFRTEGNYNDSRHPDSVNFVNDVTQDLARRDFTVNAMCYNHQEGLIDRFGGEEDFKNKVLRAVGDAKTRFTEDALRIMRLFRFASTLEFSIEKETLCAALDCAPLLKNISAERIFTELQKTANGIRPDVISPLLATNALYNYSLKNVNLNRVLCVEKNCDLRIFTFLNLASDNLENTLNTLKCSNFFKDYCFKMKYFSQNIIDNSKADIKKALNFADEEIVSDIFSYYSAVLDMNVSYRKNLLNEIILNKEPYKISHLDISGKDILAQGFKGELIGEKLEFLLQEVIKNPQLNSRKKLLELICN